MKITVLDSATLGDDLSLEGLNELGQTVIYLNTAPEEVSLHISDSDVVIVNKIKLNGKNLNKAQSLKLICVAATGFDNIDLDYCRANNIAVCNVKGYSTDSVAQLTAAMALYLYMHLGVFCEYVADGSYTKSGVANRLSPPYKEFRGKTWGIIGYGNIGKQVAVIAKALGCNVIAHSRSEVCGIECADIDTLCKTSDIISVHTPLNEDTYDLISKERIALMKKDAIFINVSRGAVADEKALCEAVSKGRLGGIGIDVYSKEPFDSMSPYAKISHLKNVCLTPHIGWGAYEARVRCLEEIIKNIKAFFAGESRNRVD